MSYRPYPHPTSPYIMHQTWTELLFLHWEIPAAALRAVVPPELPLDTFNDAAYIGIVPFMMRDVRPRFIPAVPKLSFFPELNVRTYVNLGNRPGVYFFSLDAANPIAVELARTIMHLPYQNAVMESVVHGNSVAYASTRTESHAPSAFFRATYKPIGAPYVAPPGSLDYFLTARYCLYTLNKRGNVLRAEIHHPPWQLQPASIQLETNTMTEQIGIPLPSTAPLLHYSQHQEVVVWLPSAVKPNS